MFHEGSGHKSIAACAVGNGVSSRAKIPGGLCPLRKIPNTG